MKSKKIYSKLLVAGSLLVGGLGIASCDDYLTVLPSNSVIEDDFWKEQGDVDQARAAAYAQLTGLTDKILLWGEVRSDNLSLNDMTQQGISRLQQGILMPTEGMFDWAGFYRGINLCNLVIEHGDAMTVPGQEVDPGFRLSNWRPIRSEMLALRALYYFYLVRAYRDVPYVTKAVTTDEEAMNSRIAATSGVVILGELIKQLEAENDGALKYAAENFGSQSDNKGRFTRIGIRALLADMYLWRAAMLQKSDDKGDEILDDENNPLSQASKDALSRTCLNKAIAHCDAVLHVMDSVYKKDLTDNQITNDPNQGKNYPYLTRLRSRGLQSVVDDLYSTLWAYKNSSESILELQYDGVQNSNSTVTTYFSNYSSNSLHSGRLVGNGIMTNNAGISYDPAKGYGLTDLRLLQTFAYTAATSTQPVIHKNVLQMYAVDNLRDMTEGISSATYRNNANMNWPIYRLTDIMLIKAEAIARANMDTKAADGNLVNEGFKLVNAIFERNNPALSPSKLDDGSANSDASPYISDRLNKDYAYVKDKEKNGAALLALVYEERQREFIGEGKRWFDITRQVEVSNSPSSVMSDFISLSTSVKNRLKVFQAFYNPIYSEEIKVNGVEYGGGLVQNPVWDRYTVK